MLVSLWPIKIRKASLFLAFTACFISWKLFDIAIVLMLLTILTTSPKKHWQYWKNLEIFRPLKIFNFFIFSFMLIVLAGYVFKTPLKEDQWTDIFSFRWILGFYILLAVTPNISIENKTASWLGKYLMMLLVGGLAYQYYGYFYLPHTETTDSRFMGFFHNTNHYSLCISLMWAYVMGWVSVDLVEDKKLNRTLACTLFILSICIFGSLGRSAWMGCGAAAIVCIWTYRRHTVLRRASLGILLSILALIAFDIGSIMERLMYSLDFSPNNANSLRISLWRANWAIFKDNFLLGVGYLENIKLIPLYYSKLNISNVEFYSHAHNQYLQVLAGSGLLGLICYLGIFTSALVYFYARFKHGSSQFQRKLALSATLTLVTFLFESFTESPFLLREPRNLLMLLMATTFVWCQTDQKTKFSQ